MTGMRIALPSMNDIKKVPVREEGKVIPDPVKIVSYGLNLHPGTRVAKAAYRKAVKEFPTSKHNEATENTAEKKLPRE